MSSYRPSSNGHAARSRRKLIELFSVISCIAACLAACAPQATDTLENADLSASENVQAAADKALEDAADALANTAAAEDAAAETSWAYDSSEDEMTGKTIKSACVTSENEVNLPWPYGATRGRLCLRNHPQYGRDAFVSLVGEGQILCPSYDGCELSVRFDSGEPQTFSGGAPDDHSSDMVFFSDDERPRLEKAVAHAKITRVQLDFYQAGSQAFRFRTSGFNWVGAAKPEPTESPPDTEDAVGSKGE